MFDSRPKVQFCCCWSQSIWNWVSCVFIQIGDIKYQTQPYTHTRAHTSTTIPYNLLFFHSSSIQMSIFGIPVMIIFENDDKSPFGLMLTAPNLWIGSICSCCCFWCWCWCGQTTHNQHSVACKLNHFMTIIFLCSQTPKVQLHF